VSHDLAHTHGRSDEDVHRLLRKRFGSSVDVAVGGHTHVPMLWGLADGTALVNPGSPTMPFGYRGIIGTVALLDVDAGAFEVSVVDLTTGAVVMGLAGPAPHPFETGARPLGGR
jgi:predicted phosphodiesterase